MAANQNQMNAPNVWGQMNYVPPRGQCNYRQSMLSPKCACLRFMLHPLKSSSSYECDGCAHHASFHSMENREEDEIRRRWEQEAKEKAQREEDDARPRKRTREMEYSLTSRRLLEGPGGGRMLTMEEGDAASEAGSARVKAAAKGRGKKSAGAGATGGRGAKTRGKVQELMEDDDYIELD